MKLIIVICLLLCGVLNQNSIFSQTESKNALIIANGGYRSFSLLPHLVAEARDLRRDLELIGFDVVHVENANAITMKNTLESFYATIKEQGGLALFFFSGYAMQIVDNNFLLPIDVEDINDINVEMLFDFSEILSYMEADSNIALIDASRDIPFMFSNANKGLAPLQEVNNNFLVIYSALSGTIARSGVFVSSFLSALKENAVASSLVESLQKKVQLQTKGSQNIQVYNTLSQDIAIHDLPIFEKGSRNKQKLNNIYFKSDFNGKIYLNGEFMLNVRAGKKYTLHNFSQGEYSLLFKSNSAELRTEFVLKEKENKYYHLRNIDNGIFWEGQVSFCKEENFSQKNLLVALSDKFLQGEIITVKNKITNQEIALKVVGSLPEDNNRIKPLIALSPTAAEKIGIKNNNTATNIVVIKKIMQWEEVSF
ncbi:MAG: caspase family protein [Treponemataceae bacterium]